MSEKIIEEIKKMSVMDLVNLVKKIEDEFGVSAAAPAAAVVAAPVAGSDAGSAEEKVEFKVTLKDVGAEKIKVIKALRASIQGLSLKDAKEMAEGAPCVVSESAPKDDAKKMKEALEAAGAKVELS
ncbi:50S ribosomal protein L7/L12 [Candidatus Dependentiae bacterium]|nr:50S ribosomal protein L7/L12 [Candidatus Dependentiae bacterium]